MEEEEDTFSIRDNVNNKISSDFKCPCFEATTKSSSENIEVSERKEFILSTVARTENYLRERRIPELIRFLFTKVLAHTPDKPVAFLEKLLDDCMLFRAGYGLAPVLYDDCHLEAVIKSFDPAQRGWLSVGQVQRLFTTLGFGYDEFVGDKIPREVIFNSLKKIQEIELAQLLSAGVESGLDE